MANVTQPKNKSQKTTRQRLVYLSLVLVSCGLLLAGLLGLKDRHDATTKASPPPLAHVVITQDVATPDETVPTESYNVPDEQPRRIVLGTVSAEGYIQQVGTTPGRAIAVPSNVHFGGWYTASVRPGEDGLSIIDGHVSGKYNDGIFKNLHKMQVGDKYTVEYGDKSIRGFVVVEVKTLPEKVSAEYLLTKKPDIKKQLNLITCGGKFNKSTQTFDDRVIVVSKAIE
jgi:LPXTG-site transpeptidase (sortase) family protein